MPLRVQVNPFPAWSGPSTDEKRVEIVENLRRALVFQGLEPIFR
jgi:hypothetical protein